MKILHNRLNRLFFFAFVPAAFITMAFQLHFNSPVKGSVNPSNAALRAWIFSRTDTLNSPVIQGNFIISNVKPGNYTLMVEAKPPYRDSFKQDVLVVDGQPTDVGVIEMHQ
jgi:hypothetical protein